MVSGTELLQLAPGATVRIVDEWNGKCYPNYYGYMDEYLGQVVTIDKIFESHGGFVRFHIKEDHRYRYYAPQTDKWFFNQYCVAEIVEDDPDIPEDGDCFAPPIFGNLL